MEEVSFHLSRLAKCENKNTNEPEYESRIVREHLGSNHSRLVIPFAAGMENCKQDVLARTFASRIRDHYVNLGLTTVEATPSISFEIMRGPSGGAFVSFRLPQDVHIFPEGLSSLGHMRLANLAPLQRADTDPPRVPQSKEDGLGASSKPPLTSSNSPHHVKSPSETAALPQPHVGYVRSEEAVNPQEPSKVWKTPDASSKLWRRRDMRKVKPKFPEPEKQKRISDTRTLGLAECDDSDDDFILYFDLHSASLSEIARQLSRIVQGKVPSNQKTLEQSIYQHLYTITENPGTAADAEQRVDRIMAQSQVDETWHFYLRQAVQNSDAVSKIDNLPDDPKAKARARRIAREAAAQGRRSAKLYQENSPGICYPGWEEVQRGRFQALCESGYVYQRVYTEGPDKEGQIRMERKHLLEGLKKCWGLPVGVETVDGDGMVEPVLTDDGTGDDPADELGVFESRDDPAEAAGPVESIPAEAGTGDVPAEESKVVESATAAAGTEDDLADLEEGEIPTASTERIAEV
jgi:hypothetical protein